MEIMQIVVNISYYTLIAIATLGPLLGFIVIPLLDVAYMNILSRISDRRRARRSN